MWVVERVVEYEVVDTVVYRCSTRWRGSFSLFKLPAPWYWQVPRVKALIVKHLPILVFGKTSKGILRKSDALQTEDNQASASDAVVFQAASVAVVPQVVLVPTLLVPLRLWT